MPLYDPSLNNSPDYLRLVTCYGYALNISTVELSALAAFVEETEAQGKKWDGLQPGMLAAHTNPEKIWPSLATSISSLNYFSQMAGRDGLLGCDLPYDADGPPPSRPGYYRVAIMCKAGDPSKMHIIREDDNEGDESRWSHKCGNAPASDLDDKGKKIIGDPRYANWTAYPDFLGFSYAPIERPLLLITTPLRPSRNGQRIISHLGR